MPTQTTKTAASLALAVLLIASARANATSLRTFVSGTGSDSNPCTRTAPCATLAGALVNTTTSGEVYILDAGDYSSSGGTTTISQPVSIIGAGARGGITGTVVINTTGFVLLKGLDIDAELGPGIQATVGGSNLTVDDCTIVNGLWGINFEPTTSSTPSFLVVRNSVISNCSFTLIPNTTPAGIMLAGSSAGAVYATVDNVMLNGNWHGVYALDYTNVTIRNSDITQNSHSGLRAETDNGGAVNAFVEHSHATHNLGNGVLAVNTGATIRLSEVAITDNVNGIHYQTGGAVISFGNNSVDGNTSSLAPTSTVALQ